MKRLKVSNISIRSKFIILLLLISILPSIFFAYVISLTVNKIVEKNEIENTLELIEQVNNSIEFYLENMQKITYLISYDSEVKSFLEDERSDRYQIGQLLQGFTSVNPEIAHILIVNSNGEYISNELYPKNIGLLTEEDWYLEATLNKGIFKVIGHPSNRNLISQINYSDEEIISGVRAILDPNTGEVIGVILIDLKLRFISEIVKDIQLDKSGFLMIVDDKGEIIYAPDNYIENYKYISQSEEYTEDILSELSEETDIQYLYQNLLYTDWNTIGIFEKDDLLPESLQVYFFVISYLFIILLFSITGSYYLSRVMSKPVDDLNMVMKKVEDGDLSVRYMDTRKDEIGILGDNFNRMLIQINELITINHIQDKQKREAELELLQSQIKPHFLYNTLDTINWMARKNGIHDVADIINDLSQIFRIGLSKGKEKIILEEEINHIHSYMRIQKVRYGDKLDYDIQVNSNLYKIPIIKLVLQPIVENAIYHGIKERRGRGYILVEILEVNNNLCIRVKDDGKGMATEKVDIINRNLQDGSKNLEYIRKGNNKSYGMINVHSRIRINYGEQYGLTIKSEENKGTIVTILLPIEK